MSIQDKWLEQFKAAVSHEIALANGKESDGYRAVAAKTHLGYDYIYQIYKGKPLKKPKVPGSEAMNAINREYGEVISRNLIPSPTAPVIANQAREKPASSLEDVLIALGSHLEAMRLEDRKAAMAVIERMIDQPERGADFARSIETLLPHGFQSENRLAA